MWVSLILATYYKYSSQILFRNATHVFRITSEMNVSYKYILNTFTSASFNPHSHFSDHVFCHQNSQNLVEPVKFRSARRFLPQTSSEILNSPLLHRVSFIYTLCFQSLFARCGSSLSLSSFPSGISRVFLILSRFLFHLFLKLHSGCG